jgi:hypothetical protein
VVEGFSKDCFGKSIHRTRGAEQIVAMINIPKLQNGCIFSDNLLVQEYFAKGSLNRFLVLACNVSPSCSLASEEISLYLENDFCCAHYDFRKVAKLKQLFTF